MYEQVSGLLGLEGFTVTSVEERGDELDLEVELVTAGGCCPGCGRGSCEVKERPLVRCATCRSPGGARSLSGASAAFAVTSAAARSRSGMSNCRRGSA